jgi:uncharacterized membrane protein
VNKLTAFLKAAAGGGLMVLLPVLLLCLVLAQMLQLVVALATPIAGLLQEGGLEKVASPVLVALVLLAGTSFAIGLVMQSSAGRQLGRWLERVTLKRLPIYAALKRLTRGFAGSEEGETFIPALLEIEPGIQEIVYLVEEAADGLAVVMVPHAPTAFSGPVKIVDRERLTLLDTNIGDLSRALSHWGVGTAALAARKISPGG